MLKKFNSLKLHHQIIWSLVIATDLVGIGRGLWGLMDKFFFPGDFIASSLLSLALGIAIFAVTHYSLK